jgi:Fe-S-cluster containining protein
MNLIEEFKEDSRSKRKANKKYFRRLENKNTKGLDDMFHTLHESVFEKIDCLECANCCKTTSPMFTKKDITRIAKHIKMPVSDFSEKYLKVDSDGDTVLKSAPCSFLGSDNYCSIYEVRPKACQEYPHTNRKDMHQILHTTFMNTMVCPAVFEITERLKNILPEKEM